MALTRSGKMRAFFRDVRAGTCRASEMIRLTVGSAFRKALYAMRGEGLSGENKTTPTEVLGLQPGEWVEVKSAPKIVATVDRRGRNRGLQFSGEMLAFCGKCLRVRNSLSRMILESVGEIREVKNTVILDGATCAGSLVFGGCSREVFPYWREAWLRRVSSRTPLSRPHGRKRLLSLAEELKQSA